jgi:hypothetical protein
MTRPKSIDRISFSLRLCEMQAITASPPARLRRSNNDRCLRRNARLRDGVHSRHQQERNASESRIQMQDLKLQPYQRGSFDDFIMLERLRDIGIRST